MFNLRMKESLSVGDCIDVLSIGEIVKDEHTDVVCIYKLNGFVDGKDYCDSEREQWIWSIGKNNKTGEIFASTDTRFYQNPDYECLWLR